MMSLRRMRKVLVRHLAFLGPGLVAAVAYIDPGNWATDLQAGAEYGSKLLFIVFMAGLAAVVVQILSVRLGAVTSKSLPLMTRELILSWEAKRPQYRRWYRLLLYSLWALAEIAIIATDLAELLGSAIALNLLFPKLPLFAGVLITAADVMIVLFFFRSNKGRQGMMLFEIVIVVLVLAVFVSFAILLHLIKPPWKEIFLGLVPSKTLVKPGALYIGIGIIGATVMPHALFLGSHLASIDRLDMLPVPPTREKAPRNNRLPALNPFRVFRRRQAPVTENLQLERIGTAATESQEPACTSRPEPSRLESEIVKVDQKEEDFVVAMKRYEADIRAFDRIRWVDLHVKHASVDTAYSLLGFALTINSAILTLAAAAFFYGDHGATADDADLAGAHALIRDYIGSGAAIIFALALLCAGQSASITATLAGQVVSEGFLEWKTSPMVRRMVTRLIGVIPAAIVASAIGNKGLDDMLVASQVVLSIVLPTVTIPLVYLCSQKDIMCVDGPVDEVTTVVADDHSTAGETQGASEPVEGRNTPTPAPSLQVTSTRRRRYFTSPLWVTILGYLLCALLVIANGYVIVQLCLGHG